MYMDLPTDVVRPAPDNLRRRVGDVSDIVASVPTHGIIEPLVVTPQDDGTYLIVAGHRRHAAAVKAELATVPCIVRAMTDEERVLAALIENGLRHDLRPSEEASGYFRMVEGGWTIKDLARATGRSARHVSARLALLQLPAPVRTQVDQDRISIADATELLRLKDHPEQLAEVARAITEDEVHDVGWAVRNALQQAQRQARRAKVIEELTGAGVTVVDHDASGMPGGIAELDSHRGLGIDAGAHAGEDCHVVIVTRDGDQRPACREPARHARKGTSELKVVKPPRTESADDLRRKAEHQALRESADARAEHLRELLARRLPKASVTALVFEAFLRSANQAPAKAACDLLGITGHGAKDDSIGTRAVDELMQYADAGDAHLQRAALALAFALAEEHMGASWGTIGWAQPAAITHLCFLEATGYQRSEFEEERLAQAAEALEKVAADRRRWLDRRAKEHDVPDDAEATMAEPA